MNQQQMNDPVCNEVVNKTDGNREKRARVSSDKQIQEDTKKIENEMFFLSFNVYDDEVGKSDLSMNGNATFMNDNSFFKNKKRRKKKHEHQEPLDNAFYNNNNNKIFNERNGQDVNQKGGPQQQGINSSPKQKPNTQMIRINYLLQASYLMTPINDHISRRYIKSMRRLSNKHLIRLNQYLKKSYCKKCNSVLIPSVSCTVSIEQGPSPIRIKHKKNQGIINTEKKEETTIPNSNIKQKKDPSLVCYTCNHCQNKVKFTYPLDKFNQENEIREEVSNDNVKT